MLGKTTAVLPVVQRVPSLTAEESSRTEVPSQPTPSAELADGESQPESERPREALAPASGEGEVDSSTITVEELAPATANIANALVCAQVLKDCLLTVHIIYYNSFCYFIIFVRLLETSSLTSKRLV